MSWNIQMPDAEWFTRDTPGIESLIREVADHRTVSIDTETTGLNYMKDFTLYWSLSWENKDKPGFHRRACLRADVLPFFKSVLEDADRGWALVNAKFDMHMLFNTGITLGGRIYDCSVMHALLYEEAPHKLEYMANHILGWAWKDDFKKGFREEGPHAFLTRLEKQELPRLVEYASNDAYGTICLFEKLKKELEEANTWSLYPEKYSTLADYFFKLESPFTRVLWKCERRGMYIDEPYLRTLEGPATSEINDILRKINHIAGRVINPKSTDQLRDYFFREKGYPSKKMTKGGKSGIKKESTDVEVIEWLAEEFEDPVALLMIDLRDLDKLKGTYIDGILGGLDQDGRVHTHFNQDVARTGRLSTSDIQFQNLPKPETDRFKIRKSFIHERGNKLIVADQEQLEMRLLAAATVSREHPEGERDMIQLFLDGKDIHMGNASLVFDIPYEDLVKAKKVDKQVKDGKLPESALTEYVMRCLDARYGAKAIGFGLNYGMKEGKLARQLKKTKAEAKLLIEQYMARYPAVSHFYASAIEAARGCGYSFTILGRRRFHPEIVSMNNLERWEAERKAVNNEIQGTAADIMKVAMINIDAANLDDEYGCFMLNQVHDELVFESAEETVPVCIPIIKDMMEHPFDRDLAVPLIAAIGQGDNWMEAK
jgi:DNA polymerase-1